MRRITFSLIAGLLVAGLAVGCTEQGGEEAAPETEARVAPDISVTGEVVPAVWAEVSARQSGTAVQVLVEPGSRVAEGDLLVRLDAADAELAVQQAEVALATARSQLLLLEAPSSAENVALAGAELANAQAVVSQTVAERNRLASGAISAEIAAAESALADAEALWKEAQLYYDAIQAKGDEAKDWVKQEAALRLRAAEQSVGAARMRLALVRTIADARLREVDAAVDEAAAWQDAAQSRLDMLLAGATAEEIAVAQASVSKAEAALDEASLALERTEVRAPFAGTVGMVDVREGELVVAGQPLVALGDLDTLRVETTDLDEIDVVKIAVGQQVDVSFDALPEQVFVGEITRISPMAEPGSGGVNYTVVVVLDEVDPVVKWGMTAFVDIELEE
ncbi:MAG: efflux RND transporter periplasmic adaptor subunit [Anaerolineae bacterium]|nr:efflux RND transporter periplasmic adaptor subunit [Anaerolineae bacterium]